MVMSQIGFGDLISWMFVVIGFLVVWFFLKKRIEDIEMKFIQYDEFVMVQVEFSGQIICVKGLVDFGNQLYDLLMKMLVMIFYIDKFVLIFSEKEMDIINFVGLFEVIEQFDELFWYVDKLRLILYRGVGQDN